MEREKIDLSERSKWDWRELTYDNDIHEENEDLDGDGESTIIYHCVGSDIIEYDSDNGGSVTKETTFMRASDGKYFQMISTHAYDYFEIKDNTATEVFPKIVTIVTYV